jgi:hypothetical protein
MCFEHIKFYTVLKLVLTADCSVYLTGLSAGDRLTGCLLLLGISSPLWCIQGAL